VIWRPPGKCILPCSGMREHFDLGKFVSDASRVSAGTIHFNREWTLMDANEKHAGTDSLNHSPNKGL
jgi:hypothetical protein